MFNLKVDRRVLKQDLNDLTRLGAATKMVGSPQGVPWDPEDGDILSHIPVRSAAD